MPRQKRKRFLKRHIRFQIQMRDLIRNILGRCYTASEERIISVGIQIGESSAYW